ncbi:hypothetical protein COU57_05880 [Candidatus Pacearchaeota archaeon CG10_big_fil_rev_8_21_14_0_10_32_14]|nr:MAG: hypothetical protein COU57_05880 [Candidatus Pacearchaeota archaeon CG10_big_fil_rev_8_21_14_0_10_32_14]
MDKRDIRIAIVGAGIFGGTISWLLAKEGYTVDLFDEKNEIMKCASQINQYRLHRGYHYPRSEDTIMECLRGEWEFRSVYGDSVIDDPHEHYYCIAKENSFLSADEIMKVYDRFNLEYEVADCGVASPENIEATLKVRESIFDYEKLKQIILKRINEYKVNLYLERHVEYDDLKNYDLVVIATYALTNNLLKNFPSAQNDYQFELVEKIVLDLPEKYQNKSIVVQDGPFTCIDPLGSSKYVIMGNVTHAIHLRNIGKIPQIPQEYIKLLNNGIISNPPITKINDFMDSAEKYFPGIKKSAIHIGSMYTIRTVLPFREHDDARPTIVRQIDDRTVSVFSGKIPTCITAAKDVVRIANNIHNKKKLNIGIIGVGKWGKNLLTNFHKISNIKYCANKNNTDFINENYPHIQTTLDYNNILNDESIQAVVISTPINELSKVFEDSLDHNKHIFIEKPVAHSKEVLRDILNKKEHLIKDKVVFVGYIYLHNPIYKKIKSISSQDPIKEINTHWTKVGTFDNDIFLNLVSHDLAIILDLFSTDPINLNLIKNEDVVSQSDIINLEMQFDNKRKASISIDRVHPSKSKEIKFVTNSGRIFYWIDHQLFEFDKVSKEFIKLYENNEDLIKIEALSFIDAVLNKKYDNDHLYLSYKILDNIDKIKQLI